MVTNKAHHQITTFSHSQPFDSQDFISNSPYCLPYSSCDVSLENLVLNQLIVPYLRFFLYSHYSSAWHCIDIVRRNSVLVTHGSYMLRVKCLWGDVTTLLIGKQWYYFYLACFLSLNFWDTSHYDSSTVFPQFKITRWWVQQIANHFIIDLMDKECKISF